MAGEPSWFEIGVGDAARAQEFYAALLGWEFEAGPSGDLSHGAVIRTPGVDGGLHGGDQGASPLVFFRVDDMDLALEQVRELGGRVESSPDVDPEASDPEFGRFALCRDDQGSSFGLHQPPG